MTDLTKDGGPAFPSRRDIPFRGGGSYREDKPGMSLRAYFIAHAPDKPQRWFTPVLPPRPTLECLPCGEPFSNERARYNAAASAHETALSKWTEDSEKQRYVQWPAAWADALLAELAKEAV